MTNIDTDFEAWYEALLQELHDRAIFHADRATARGDYDLGYTPHTSAELFAKQEPPMMGTSY